MEIQKKNTAKLYVDALLYTAVFIDWLDSRSPAGFIYPFIKWIDQIDSLLVC